MRWKWNPDKFVHLSVRVQMLMSKNKFFNAIRIMKKCFFPILVTFVTLLIACQENERPVPMQVEINGQVEILATKLTL